MMEFITDMLVWTLLKSLHLCEILARFFIKLVLPFAIPYVTNALEEIGINLKGEGPLGIHVHDKNEFYLRLALTKSFGLFEAHMDKVCTMNDVKAIAINTLDDRRMKEFVHPFTRIFTWFNLQTRAKAWQVGVEHYDVGNDIYTAMLDKNMQYTCGYWKDTDDLDTAQIQKMDLIAHKLKLQPGMTVLDIGCGFGTLGYHLAKNYGVKFTGCSISVEQTKYGTALCAGLPVEFRLCDYRDLDEKFDRIVSVGMFEHVGHHNYAQFMQVCHRCLKDDGILLLHTIGNNHQSVSGFDMWAHKYIFPNGYIPYYKEICNSIENRFVIEDWQNFGHYYSKTLAAWEQNFEGAWPTLNKKYGERFYRMWNIYLACAQALFLTRSLQVWQIVMSKDGLRGGYEAVRI